MKVTKEENEVILRLSAKEVRIITSAMNEICHGASIPKSDFPSRIGRTKEEVVAMLDSIIEVAKTL